MSPILKNVPIYVPYGALLVCLLGAVIANVAALTRGGTCFTWFGCCAAVVICLLAILAEIAGVYAAFIGFLFGVAEGDGEKLALLAALGLLASGTFSVVAAAILHWGAVSPFGTGAALLATFFAWAAAGLLRIL